jgi:deoxyribose-phosphate aldolase
MKTSKYIDHTLLKPESTRTDIDRIVEEALTYDFATVMVNPCWVSYVKPKLAGSTVKAACVIGFPLGANTTAVKVYEIQDALKNGADEVDMVINIGALKDGRDDYVTDEIRACREAAGDHCLKVIIETCLLSEEEKVRACQDAARAGADFVKTSTGFSKGGATVEDVALMKKAVEGTSVKVKASGGVRTKEEMDAMIAAGAERIGTSHGVELVQ